MDYYSCFLTCTKSFLFFPVKCPFYLFLSKYYPSFKGIRAWPLVTMLLYQHFLPTDPTHVHGFKYYLHASDSQVCIFSSYAPTELQICIFDCQYVISTWMSNRDLKFNMVKLEFLFISSLNPTLSKGLLNFSKCHHYSSAKKPRSHLNSCTFLTHHRQFIRKPF